MNGDIILVARIANGTKMENIIPIEVLMKDIILSCLVIVLAAIAGIVLYGLVKKRNMWIWIIAYWAVLTLKNIADFIFMIFGD